VPARWSTTTAGELVAAAAAPCRSTTPAPLWRVIGAVPVDVPGVAAACRSVAHSASGGALVDDAAGAVPVDAAAGELVDAAVVPQCRRAGRWRRGAARWSTTAAGATTGAVPQCGRPRQRRRGASSAPCRTMCRMSRQRAAAWRTARLVTCWRGAGAALE